MAAWAYYQQGFVDLKVGIILSIGFVIGSLLGAKFAIGLPELFLKQMFGTLMLVIALKMILTKWVKACRDWDKHISASLKNFFDISTEVRI